MKSKLAIVGLIVTAVMLGSLSSARAVEYSPILTVSNQGGTWIQFDTQLGNVKYFTGKDVIRGKVVVEYWLTIEGGVDGPYSLQYSSISLADSQVKIFFNLETIPQNIAYFHVTGELVDGSTFMAQGPGWVWSNVHG